MQKGIGLVMNGRGIWLALFLSVLLIFPSIAYAEVRTSDIVAGTSASSRGLSTSDLPSIDAQYAYVVSEDGTVYFERDADKQTHIASVTKIMTALVALEYGDPKNTTITVSKKASAIGESSAALRSGDKLTLENALKAMMICSGNDAAYAIAESMGDTIKQKLQEAGDESVPDNAYDAFIYAMNKKAADLGMKNSLFANPHGLDFDKYDQKMYSSARDVSLMCAAAMDYDLFRSIVATDTEKIDVDRSGKTVKVSLESTDILLGSYKGACGIKTGYTEKAGECFAGAVELENGEILYAIVLDSSSESQRFKDATTLDDWVKDNTISYPLIHSDETTTYEKDGTQVTVPVVAHVSHAGWIDKTFAATLADPQDAVEVFRLEGNVSQEVLFDDVSGDVHVGQKVGTVNFYQHNEVVKSVDLVAAEECPAPSFFEGIDIWWSRLTSGFTGSETVAKSTVVNTTPLIYGANATLDTKD